MKINVENLRELIGFGIKVEALEELIDWIDAYEYHYEIIDGVLVREDMQDKDAGVNIYTVKEFIKDWYCEFNINRLDYLEEASEEGAKKFKAMILELKRVELDMIQYK